jgi:hypothetical protein
MFWLLVFFGEVLYAKWFLKDILAKKVSVPVLKTVSAPLIIILMVLPSLRFDNHLSGADNYYNHVELVCMILTVIPLIFFEQKPKSKTAPLSSL